MNGNERQRIVQEVSNLETQKEVNIYIAVKIEETLSTVRDHGKKLGALHDRIKGIENWKLKVTTTSGVIGAIVGFLGSLLWK